MRCKGQEMLPNSQLLCFNFEYRLKGQSPSSALFVLLQEAKIWTTSFKFQLAKNLPASHIHIYHRKDLKLQFWNTLTNYCMPVETLIIPRATSAWNTFLTWVARALLSLSSPPTPLHTLRKSEKPLLPFPSNDKGMDQMPVARFTRPTLRPAGEFFSCLCLRSKTFSKLLPRETKETRKYYIFTLLILSVLSVHIHDSPTSRLEFP